MVLADTGTEHVLHLHREGVDPEMAKNVLRAMSRGYELCRKTALAEVPSALARLFSAQARELAEQKQLRAAVLSCRMALIECLLRDQSVSMADFYKTVVAARWTSLRSDCYEQQVVNVVRDLIEGNIDGIKATALHELRKGERKK